MRNSRHSLVTMKEELRPGFGFRSGIESGGGRRRRRGENRGQRKGKRSSRRDRENQWAFEAPPSAQERYGPGSRISMQASGNPQCAAASQTGRTHDSAFSAAWSQTRKLNPFRRGRPHARALPEPVQFLVRFEAIC